MAMLFDFRLEEVLKEATERQFNVGQTVLYFPNRTKPTVGYLKKGTLACHVRYAAGQDEFNSHFITSSSWIGVENLYDAPQHSMRWRAETDCELAFLPLEKLKKLMTTQDLGPGLAISIVQSSSALTHHLSCKRVVDQQSEEDRFQITLKELIEVKGQPEGNQIVLAGLSQADLASHAGLSLSFVTKRLQKMRKEGSIEVKRRCIYVNNNGAAHP